MNMPYRLRYYWILFTTLAVLMTACGPATSTPTGTTLEPTTAAGTAITPRPNATLLATPSVKRDLNICLGGEPNTLYPYGSPNAAARGVLSALYDGPIDNVTYSYEPVILEKLPTLEDGDAQVTSVEVETGDTVVDVDGNLVALEEGMYVYPTGCTDADCVEEYDGVTTLEMDQITATFKLLPDLTWSDGEPVTADDSVFGFELASDPATPGSRFLIDHTVSYEADDESTVTWTGVPGYVDASFNINFFAPAPRHAWGQISAADLLSADVDTRPALGWGPYVLDEWAKGESITLIRNPDYFRAAEGLPKFETVTFLFMENADAGIAALLNGTCDVLDTSLRLDGQIGLIDQLTQSGKITSSIQTTPMMERLDFGIYHSSYDDDDETNDRPDFFSDVNTRKGIALCLDRQQVVDTVLSGFSTVPNSFVPADHPLYNDNVQTYPYDVQLGASLLEQAGWVDDDHNPATPRVARDMDVVPDNTRLILNYYTTNALQRRQASEIFAASLAKCGVKLNIQYLTPAQLYAPGPAGPLFGRKFDLAQYAVASTGNELPCSWFTSAEIPYAETNWLGLNVSGYSDGDFDFICSTAMNALTDNPSYYQAYQDLQEIFADTLPSIPLYQRLKIGAARPDMCGFVLDPAAASDLWNIEMFDYGACE
jgi:peptide/nickel transport system substrate-binding protein